MSKVISQKKLSDTLTLSECKDGWWIWDSMQGMNLAMHEKTEQAAIMEVIDYYQRRLPDVEQKLKAAEAKLEAVYKIVKPEDEDYE